MGAVIVSGRPSGIRPTILSSTSPAATGRSAPNSAVDGSSRMRSISLRARSSPTSVRSPSAMLLIARSITRAKCNAIRSAASGVRSAERIGSSAASKLLSCPSSPAVTRTSYRPRSREVIVYHRQGARDISGAFDHTDPSRPLLSRRHSHCAGNTSQQILHTNSPQYACH